MSGTRTGTTIVSLDDLDPINMLRVGRMARELRLAGQILSDDLDTVEVVRDHCAPGSTSQDGTRITLDYNALGTPWMRRQIAVWIGTFAHEIGHSKFSPRAQSELMVKVNYQHSTSKPGIHQVWNMMEDARQERLLLGQFEAWRAYLAAMFEKHFDLSNPGTFLTAVGRTWLPRSVRDGVRALFIGHVMVEGGHTAQAANDLADEITRLIGVYQRLGDPGDLDADIAWLSIEQMYRLLQEPGMPRLNQGCSSTAMTGGWPEDGDAAQEQAESIPTADDEEPEDDPSVADDGDDGEGDDESDDAGSLAPTNDDEDDGTEGDDESEGDGDAGDDGEGEDEGDDESDDGDGSGDEDDEPEQGDGGEGEGTQANVDPKALERALRNGVDDMLHDEDTAADLDRVQDALDNGGVGSGSDTPPSKGEWIEATDKALVLERDVTDALMDLREAAEPGWHRRVGTGRLSVRRFLTDPNWTPEDVFDRFDPGQLDCTALDVVLIADVSGSMHGQVSQLGDAVWAIRRAVDALEGTCSTLTFSDGWAEMPGSGDRPDGRVFVPKADGGTRPVGAIREAARIVMESEAMHKLVIVLTDGVWQESPKIPEAVAAIHDAGGTTVFVGLKGAYVIDTSYAEQCGFEYTAEIREPKDLAILFRDVAYKLMAESMAFG